MRNRRLDTNWMEERGGEGGRQCAVVGSVVGTATTGDDNALWSCGREGREMQLLHQHQQLPLSLYCPPHGTSKPSNPACHPTRHWCKPARAFSTSPASTAAHGTPVISHQSSAIPHPTAAATAAATAADSILFTLILTRRVFHFQNTSCSKLPISTSLTTIPAQRGTLMFCSRGQGTTTKWPVSSRRVWSRKGTNPDALCQISKSNVHEVSR
ncbi:hypothetical protein N431DRAFT_240182 [Stipitochalara longipes BDJ]|nr:hypothetical protein N431DRAFT_240182 [Stipitochalara longipes BDJ]